MKKAVLTAIGILTAVCTGAEAFESLAAETEKPELVIEVQDPVTEDADTESMSVRNAEEETEGTGKTDEWADADEASAEAENDEIFVLMVLPCEEAALSVLGEPELFTEDTVICPVLITGDDLEEMGEIGEDQIYYWTIAEEEPEVYLRASLVDGSLVFETEETEEDETGTEEAQEYEAEDTEAVEAADEDETEDSSENTSSSTSKKKKSSSSSSAKKSSSKSSSGKTRAKSAPSADSSSEKTSSTSSKKSSGKHKSASAEDTTEAERSVTEEDESSGEKGESSEHSSAGRKEASAEEREDASGAEQNNDISGENEVPEEETDTEINALTYALPAAAGMGGLLTAAALFFLKRRKNNSADQMQ